MDKSSENLEKLNRHGFEKEKVSIGQLDIKDFHICTKVVQEFLEFAEIGAGRKASDTKARVISGNKN